MIKNVNKSTYLQSNPKEYEDYGMIEYDDA